MTDDDLSTGSDPQSGHLARPVPGTELLGPSDGDDRWLARRPDGRIVRMPWLLHRVASLLDGTRGTAAVAREITEHDGHSVTGDEVARIVEQRLVPAGLVLAPTAGDSADPHAVTGRGPRRVAAGLVLAALVLVAGTAGATMLLVSPTGVPVAPAVAAGPEPAEPVTAPGGLVGPPTLVGRVVEVPDVTTAVVDVRGRGLRVDVAGLAPGATPPCAAGDAVAFARRTLQGEQVTLVPDPTLPPSPPGRWRAYLVLGSQLSFTDAALRAGWARAGEGRYREGFVGGEADAREAGRGQWGPPCRSSP